MTKKHLNLINRLLFFGILFINVITFALPLLPEIEYRIENILNPNLDPVYQSNLAVLIRGENNEDSNKELKAPPEENTLIIPAIRLDTKVFEGDIDNLNKGIWHRNFSGDPAAGGNMVLIGHRFQFTSGENTFYQLPKVKEGDLIGLFWNQVEYNYKIEEVFEVNPSDVYIENPTEEHILTLYTCTPLWTADKRLVVRARMI